jgi:hypothetical protein
MRSRWGFGSFVCLSLYFYMPALQAEVPKDTLVQAWQIDDLITLDPAEVFEFSGAEYAANVYDRLVTYRPTTSRTCRATSPRAGRSPTTARPTPSRSGRASPSTAAIR